MDALIELLANIPADRLGTVVHIGAGNTDPADYGSLNALRLVMVEGDASRARELRAVVAPKVGSMQVLQQPVAAATGPMTWNRFNVSSLDGPLDPGGLARHYPRLHRAAEESVQALSLGDLLASLGLERRSSQHRHEPNVLLLDVPGQEESLLTSLARAQLQAFGWIAVRARGERLDAAGRGLTALASRLDEAHFERVLLEDHHDTLWSHCLFRLAVQHVDKEEEIERRLGELNRQLEAVKADRDEQAHWHQENANWARALSAENEQLKLEVERMKAELEVARANERQLKAQHQENAHRTGTLNADIERLELETQHLKTELEGMKTSERQLKVHLDDCIRARTEAERELADRDVRQRLLDAEILKAEAQLELVKDVLLREKNF
jgi:hypothetical protein